jgi:hypothetical protein
MSDGTTDKIELPRLGKYKDMQKLTGRSYQTIARWVCRRKLRPGVYVGKGMFNLSRVRELFDREESFFLESEGKNVKL